MPNRLAKESSPYLLQHKNNPVDWYSWGEEALSRARAENKPILLSVGYSACHWCHVMEHESFENAAIAKLMNDNFVCIKVDREERPDLDQIYQNVAQAMTRSGGWPLTVFLTPELKPFFGGTYFPPDDRYGRPGFPRVLTSLANAYRSDFAAVTENATRLTEFIQGMESRRAGAGEESSGEPRALTRADLADVASRLLGAVDWQDGGLGDAPKFPNAMVFTFLWRHGCAEQSDRSREAALLTLEKIARGGIFDQLGGGFHRYSVDGTWSVPHFEKMLYDNGLLLKLLAEVLLSPEPLGGSGRRELYLDALSSSVDYLLREMVSPEGLFYAAQDADSEGEEGRFFVWDPADLARLLTKEEAAAFALRYGVTADGNFEHGKTVLYQAKTRDEVAGELPRTKVPELLESACAKLFRERSGRIPPATDTKRLAGWNGLVISGLAWAGQALIKCGRAEVGERAAQAAQRAFAAARQYFSQPGARPEGRLFSTYQSLAQAGPRANGHADAQERPHASKQSGNPSGEAKHNGYLDDYAFLAMAALDVARMTVDDAAEVAELLDASDEWIQGIIRHFATPDRCGYFFTSDDHESLIHRPRSLTDQAIPSGTAVALECMAALEAMDWKGAGARYRKELDEQQKALGAAASRNPYASSELLSFALLRVLEPIAMSGRTRDGITHAHVFRKPPAVDASFASGVKGTILCHRQTCLEPTADAAVLEREVQARCRFS